MENNNNGRGIFYGVIGVATLIVAIIGATFAYFSAQANSAENAIATNSTVVQAFTFTDVTTGLRTELIPVNAADPNFKNFPGLAADANTGAATLDPCEDANGNDICSVYNFTVTNGGSVAQPAYFFLKANVNTFTNLRYAIFKGLPDTGAWDVTGLNATEGGISGEGTADDGDLLVSNGSQLLKANGSGTTEFALTALDHTLNPNQSDTYTIVLWIEEVNTDQTEADSGKQFAATVRVSTNSGVGNGTGITGVLTAGGHEEYYSPPM